MVGTDVECPVIDSFDANRVMSVEGNRMHDRSRFSCVEGYYLSGTQEITCLSNGLWSDSPPKCKVIECPALNTDEDLYVRVSDHNRTYGSSALFSCTTGYKLIGAQFVTCLKNRTWSQDIPHCEAISCEPPIAPQNGRLLDNTHYLAGDYVQYACNSGFVIMGEPLAICMDNGTWSSPPPILTARYIVSSQRLYDLIEGEEAVE
ncbi:unnamed protein product [Medioppia subpectinata]|uniref:Sushi domain-containing protein n=1 Tax=Medioppia subpectinata TaxID=1979941 RepID=A0A7R9KKL7_9ACAR|nr:unnamed protein product [Medioppia subpectinata]CAG2105179.1 unnamed protein product [Medioppia subpectinata]